MTILTGDTRSGNSPISEGRSPDHRGSWIPPWRMISTRFMELRKRRGLMVALVFVTIGIPVIFLGIRLILHAADPTTYGPAGGYDIYAALTTHAMYLFGFIVAAALGCTAGSVDLSEGMFRHLVITGRSRIALYFARIPAGLAIIAALVAIGFTIICAVCVFAAPQKLSFDGVNVPAGLSRPGLEAWASNHADEVICNFNYNGPNPPLNVPCGGGSGGGGRVIKGPPTGFFLQTTPTPAMIRAQAIQIADQDFARYSKLFLYPSVSLMVRTGLWLELEAGIGFLVGLGLGSVLGQRTIAVILMIALELVVTPIVSFVRIPYMSNLQRSVFGLAVVHLEPGSLPLPMGGGGPNSGGGGPLLLPESRLVSICVILAWLVGWTVLGAWRMATRDA